ncbi:MAG TPA: primosomal protein N' [Gemmatimonadales bacterium]|nr:primosomal protein N' [Gemmatimonadales bacterium]
MTGRLARIQLPLPLDSPYTYRLPGALADRAAVGMRASVPLRRRTLIGVITELDAAEAAREPKDVIALPDDAAALSPSLIELACWMARYYGAPLGLAMRALLPGALWGSDSAAKRDERIVTLADERPTLLERDKLFRRRPRQRALFEAIEGLGGASEVSHLRDQLGFTDALIKSLVSNGYAEFSRSAVFRDPFAGLPETPLPPSFTAAQRAALASLAEVPPGGTALLYGVTGSGKTLVYLEAARLAVEAGRSAIVLVPEIGLTPQTVSRFRGAFGDQVAVLHSGLSDGERADAWRLLQSGRRRVAVGARSAIFAPVPDLGLIVVDEEHESSYKNGESPRYHAREVAAMRARLEGARLILGSATPSLETFARCHGSDAAVRLLSLPERVESRPMPPVELVNLRTAPMVRELWPVPWSEQLDQALTQVLERREQALLLLNRRGFANFLQCATCGTVSQCPHCSIALTVHQSPRGLRCHYCDHTEAMPSACAECHGDVQQMRGVGTQQLEQAIAMRFPAARIARMDLDTTSTKWSHQRILGAVERGEVDILLGTQMIAKGLDFPNVTLVGVVDADTGLFLPDFRAAERTFQLLAQVSGRAGRGAKGGRVLVQTRAPEHPALAHASRHDTDGFLNAELQARESPTYPPHVTLVNTIFSGDDELGVSAAAARFAEWCERLFQKHALPLELLGPAPCPVVRVRERWRWHVLVRGPGRPMGGFVRAAARMAARRRDTRITLDRDPVTLL